MGLKRSLMDKMMPKEFGAISGLFHVGVFSLQRNILDLVGESGFKEYIFPAVQNSIEKVADIGLESIEGESIEDFASRFINLLKKSCLVKDAQVINPTETEYIFEMTGCFMAKTAHKMAGNQGLCPMAMVVASMINKYTKKEVSLEHSSLTPNGSITKIKVIQ